MENLQKLSLDIMNNHTYDYIFANQDDVGRTVEITITDNNEPMDLRGVKAVFFMKKPDGTTVTNNVSVQGSVVTVVITAEMTSCPGKAAYQIKLEKEPNFISTIKGVFLVESSAIQEGDMPSGHESTMWEDIIKRSDDTERYFRSVEAMVAGQVNQEGLIPMGTIHFSELADLTPLPRQLYTVLDAFVSDDTFIDGGGVSYPGGVNVYRNSEDDNPKWIAIPGAYLSIANNVPTNGTGVWLEEYDPGADPGPTPPSYNDDVFFTSAYDDEQESRFKGLGRVIYDHIVSFDHPISFRKSDEKRGCPYMLEDDNVIYLDFVVNSDNTQTVWWWVEGNSDLEFDVGTVFDIKGEKQGELFTNGYLSEAINYYDFSGINDIIFTDPTTMNEHGIVYQKQNATLLTDGCTIYTTIGYDMTLFGYSEDLTFSGRNITWVGSPHSLFEGTSIEDDELDISNWVFQHTSWSGDDSILGTIGVDKIVARNWDFTDGYGGYIPRLYRIPFDSGYPISYLDLTGWVLSTGGSSHVPISSVFKVYDESRAMDVSIFENDVNVIGIDTWDMSQVEDMSSLFTYVSPYLMRDIDLSQWNISAVTDMQYIFRGSNLTANTLRSIRNWDVSNVDYFGYAFAETGESVGYDFSFLDNWDVNGDGNWMMHLNNHYEPWTTVFPKWDGWFSYGDDGSYFKYQLNHVPRVYFQGLLPDNTYLPIYDMSVGDAYTLLEDEKYVYWDGSMWRTDNDDEFVPDPDPGT